ncbi:MAG: hypothetical protein L0Y80_06810 [Ignavibacteriae bacterium]|nr:hypothetical protein [Ignavibacteriota bacterium]
MNFRKATALRIAWMACILMNVFSAAIAQSVYYDAIRVRTHYSSSIDSVLTVLAQYAHSPSQQQLRLEEIAKSYEKNPFLKPFIDNLVSQKKRLDDFIVETAKDIQKIEKKDIEKLNLPDSLENKIKDLVIKKLKTIRDKRDSVLTVHRQDTARLAGLDKLSLSDSAEVKQSYNVDASIDSAAFTASKALRVEQLKAQIEASLLTFDSLSKDLIILSQDVARILKNANKGFDGKFARLEGAQEGMVSGQFFGGFSSVKPHEQTMVVVVAGSQSSFQTSMIDATASFIAGRFKEEVSLVFFEKMKDYMSNKESDQLQALFPTTSGLFKATNDINYSTFLQVIKGAFEKDMQNLIYSLPVFFEKAFLQEGGQTSPEVLYTLLLIKTLSSLRDGTHILETLRELQITDDTSLKTYTDAISIALEVSNSLRSNDVSKSIWVTFSEFQRLKMNTELRNIYLGLLFQELKQLQDDKLTAVVADSAKYFPLVEKFFVLASSIDRQTMRWKQLAAQGSGLTAEQTLNFLISELDLVDYVQQISDSLRARQIDNTTRPLPKAQLVEIKRAVLEAYSACQQKEYGAALSNVLFLLHTTLGNEFNNHSELIRYGSFMVAVAQAKNSQEMQSAIEAASLPAGSYSIKRKSAKNISLNAFVGITGGWEQAFKGKRTEDSGNLGFTAPIGIAYSWGLGTPEVSAVTVFVSFIDLGAVVNFRLGDNRTALPEGVTFANLVAPGIYLIYGFEGVPLALGVNVAMSPKLRQITDGDSQILDANAFRINLSFTVDIPLLNFYTR